ncbi:MAG: hypothetical protein ACMUJM_24345 [bacterium]
MKAKIRSRMICALCILLCSYVILRANFSQAQKNPMQSQALSGGSAPMDMLYAVMADSAAILEQAVFASIQPYALVIPFLNSYPTLPQSAISPNPAYDTSLSDSYILRAAHRPPIIDQGQAHIPLVPNLYYVPGAVQYSPMDSYPYPGPDYFIDTFNLGLDLFNTDMMPRIRTPVPGGFIVSITETEEYDEEPITQGVQVYFYDQRIDPKRGSGGLYFILLLQGPYRLTFAKEGYKNYYYPEDGEGYITSSIPSYLRIKMERDPDSHSLRPFITPPPLFLDIPDIYVIAGETIVIESQVSPSEGDMPYIIYSGWMSTNTRRTTDKDIGWHQVLVTLINKNGYSDSQIVDIYVLAPLPDKSVSD